jgi:hypothetical protein|tara:strand:- start:25 stop:396 length:372 start_codon:yes stop_codon:yes gene_type:complete
VKPTQDINMTQNKDDPAIKIAFAPGAFDNFEGTQDELDEFIAEITAQAESGELLTQSEPVDLEALFAEDPEMALSIAAAMGMLDDLDAESMAALQELSSILEAQGIVPGDNLTVNPIKNRRLN